LHALGQQEIISRPRRTGFKRLGAGSVSTKKLVADNVQGVIIPGSGQWVAEEAPEKLLAALASFLAPHRDGLFVAQ